MSISAVNIEVIGGVPPAKKIVLEERSKTIWTYWHQGLTQAPKIVKICIVQWQNMNPDWKVRLLDEETVKKFVTIDKLSQEKWKQLSIAHRSDILRTELLIRYGGVWADPTTFCTTPLDEWLQDNLVAGFFFFSHPGRDRIISNWFIAAERGNIQLRSLLEKLYSYWNKKEVRPLNKNQIKRNKKLERVINRRPVLTRFWLTNFAILNLPGVPYFIYHYTWNDLVSAEVEAKKLWNEMPKILAEPLHQLQTFGMLKPVNLEVKKWLDDNPQPMFKLDWKKLNNQNWKETSLQFLLNKYTK